MLPHLPTRRPQLGFLFLPPYRVQGVSVAGEETFVQIPELDVCFDIGRAPRATLASDFVALSHGHMDHSAGLAYYFSQRNFMGMGTGTVVCHPSMEKPIHALMRSWIDVEAQRTPYKVITLEPGQEIEIKNSIFLRAFATNHTVASLGFVVVEKRSKLKVEYVGLPQEKLVALKKAGETITRTIEIPQVCYMGDTAWGDHFEREDVLNSQILITECTFLEPGHRDRANVGKHLHLDDVVELLKTAKSEAVVLTHLSRRTHMGQAMKWLGEAVPADQFERLFLLMNYRDNRKRYEKQAQEMEIDDSELEDGDILVDEE